MAIYGTRAPVQGRYQPHEDVFGLLMLPGVARRRYTTSDVAYSLGVGYGEVLHWISMGWLRAHLDNLGQYRIRRRAIRFAIRDYPQVQHAVAKARLKRIEKEAKAKVARGTDGNDCPECALKGPLGCRAHQRDRT